MLDEAGEVPVSDGSIELELQPDQAVCFRPA
jgi:hypothetical protein